MNLYCLQPIKPQRNELSTNLLNLVPYFRAAAYSEEKQHLVEDLVDRSITNVSIYLTAPVGILLVGAPTTGTGWQFQLLTRCSNVPLHIMHIRHRSTCTYRKRSQYDEIITIPRLFLTTLIFNI